MTVVAQLWRRGATVVVTVVCAGSVVYFVPALANERYTAGWSEVAAGYWQWWADVAQGGFLVPKVSQAMPWTLTLVGISTAVAFAIGTVAGALIASPAGRIATLARWATPAALALYATPFFVFGMVMLWLFVWLLDWFPTGGGYTHGETPEWSLHGVRTLLWHGTLPLASIILVGLGQWLVSMRSLMVLTVGEDYVTHARSMGLRRWRIMAYYQMRNCMLPQVTLLIMNLGLVFAGAVLVEIVFAYPGVGYVLQQAILGNDLRTVSSVVITVSVMFAMLLGVMEILYRVLDRRIASTT